MIYEYMRLPDDTEITHTETQQDGSVIVYIETPHEKDGFHHAKCILPAYEWSDIFGYSEKELAYFKDMIESRCFEIMAKWKERFGEISYYC